MCIMLNEIADANESDYRPGDPGDWMPSQAEAGSEWSHRPGNGTGMRPNPSMSFPLDKEASSAVGIPIFKNNFLLGSVLES
jgi:hypothetical protein